MMYIKASVLLSSVIIINILRHALGQYRVVCYYTNWSQYRNDIGKFYPENVDPSLCTHINYAFAKLSGNELAPFEWNDESTDWSSGMYERLQALKSSNSNLKTLLAVGGWIMGSEPFTSLVSSTGNMSEFASSSITYLRKNGFDGLDIDWEYPAQRGSPTADKYRFATLVQTVMNAFIQEAASTGSDRLLLTAAVGAGKDKVDEGYDVTAISQYLDFINLMTYDLHGSWESTVGHNSPLFARSDESGNQAYLNMDWAARYWVSNGAPKSKLNIGMGLYGRTFTLSDSSSYLPGAAASGAGTAGTYTREKGFLAYYEICTMSKTVYEIEEQGVRYAVNGNQWVGYDDPESLREKVCYVKTNGYGGVMVWALDLDDFGGQCSSGVKYPLLNAINSELSQSGCSSSNSLLQQSSSNQVLTTAVPQFANNPFTYRITNTQQAAPTQSTVVQLQPYQYIAEQQLYQQSQQQQAYQSQQQQAYQSQQQPSQSYQPYQSQQQPSQSQQQSYQYQQPYQSQQQTYQPQQQSYGGQISPYGSTNVYQNGYQTQLPPFFSNGFTNQQQFSCSGRMNDHYPNNYDCSSYHVCSNSIRYDVKCQQGLYYNSYRKQCDMPQNVQCVNQGVTIMPSTSPTTRTVWSAQSANRLVNNQQQTYSAQTRNGNNNALASTSGTGKFCSNKSDGYYSDPQDCSMFYRCASSTTWHMSCPPSTVFNEKYSHCDHAYNVAGCN